MREAIAALLMCVCVALPPFSSANKPPDRKQELDELRTRIDKLQRDVGKSEESRGEVADQLKTSEKAISEVNRALTGLRREQAAMGKELQTLGAQRTAAAMLLRREKEQLERVVRYQYMHRDGDALRLLLGGEDLAAVERQLTYLGYVSKARASAVAATKRAADALAEIERSTVVKRDEIATNANAQEKARQLLERERTARQQVMNKIKADITKSRREIGRLKRDEDRLSKLVDQLARALAEQSASRSEPRRRGTPSAPNNRGGAPSGERKPGMAVNEVADEGFIGRAFSTLRGKLKLPVKGELAGRFGAPREDGGVTWKGLFIRAEESQPVRVVADGRVVYADWFRGYGNLIIVDHGSGYLSLYGNNESTLKGVGESVKSGETIASVGSSGGALESGVYFELRQEGKPFDPMRWVGR